MQVEAIFWKHPTGGIDCSLVEGRSREETIISIKTAGGKIVLSTELEVRDQFMDRWRLMMALDRLGGGNPEMRFVIEDLLRDAVRSAMVAPQLFK